MGQKGASALQENPLSQVINSPGNPTLQHPSYKCWLCSGTGPGRGIKSEQSDCFPSWGLCGRGMPLILGKAARPTQVAQVADGVVTPMGPKHRDEAAGSVARAAGRYHKHLCSASRQTSPPSHTSKFPWDPAGHSGLLPHFQPSLYTSLFPCLPELTLH